MSYKTRRWLVRPLTMMKFWHKWLSMTREGHSVTREGLEQTLSCQSEMTTPAWPVWPVVSPARSAVTAPSLLLIQFATALPFCLHIYVWTNRVHNAMGDRNTVRSVLEWRQKPHLWPFCQTAGISWYMMHIKLHQCNVSSCSYDDTLAGKTWCLLIAAINSNTTTHLQLIETYRAKQHAEKSDTHVLCSFQLSQLHTW